MSQFPTGTDATTEGELTDGPNLALILAVIIIGAAIFLVVLVALFIGIFFIRDGFKRSQRRRKKRNGPSENNIETGTVTEEEVVPPIPLRPSAVADQTDSQVGEQRHSRPREIVSLYDIDIPATFRPFPQPPPVTGLTNTGRQNSDSPRGLANLNTGVHTLPKELERGLAGSNEENDGEDHEQDDWHTPEPFYDSVETLHEDHLSLTSSGTSSTKNLLVSLRNAAASEYNSRSLPLASSKRKSDPKYDRIYSERLEPSMLQSLSRLDDKNVPALPYAPVYDLPRSLRKSEQPLQISRTSIVEIRDLGNGHFGRVVLASTTGLSLKDLKLGQKDDKSCSILVAIKQLKQDADHTLKDAFQMEIKFMSRLKHANVVRLLGVCTSTSNECFLMMEYMENGDLQDFLRKQKLVPDTVDNLKDGEVTPLILLYMSVQIASGMRYLASRRFVHRDLASRNCLVGRDFIVKISDFGMSRNLYDNSYYRVEGRLILPIRWMAFESFYGKFSVKSDAWAFGTVMWEIYMLAQEDPYLDMTDEEIISDAIRGAGRRLLAQPENCPAEVYDVMQRCWVHEPLMRADFEEVYSRLYLIYTTLSSQAQ